MTDAALPLIEALALLREEAVRCGHEMAPAVRNYTGHGERISSGCTRCFGWCAVDRRDGAIVQYPLLAYQPCEPMKEGG